MHVHKILTKIIQNTIYKVRISFCPQFYTQVNTTNSNVVRVAPRPKNPAAAATYNYNLANSFPSNTPYNIYPTNASNIYPNFSVNSINYTNYPTSEKQSSASSSSLATKQQKRISNDEAPSNGILASALNPFLAGGCSSKSDRKTNEKKFNSLKSIGVKKAPQFYSMRANKCKRHHSLVGVNGSGNGDPQQLQILIESSASTHSMPYISQKLRPLEQPLYENLTDSIQIHESSLQSDRIAYDEANNGEFQCDPDERNSIYRSDSGISNSSYECITPVPAPRTHPRKNHSAPVYMNLPNSSSKSQHKKHTKCDTATGRAFYNYEVSVLFIYSIGHIKVKARILFRTAFSRL